MLARIPGIAASELEIKFQLGDGAAEALQAHAFPAARAAVSNMRATYFDTPARALRDGGFSLRVRCKDGKYVQTLKHRAAGGLFERDEWETPVPGPELDLEALSCTPASDTVDDHPLEPAFTVDVERRTHMWIDGETRVEVSFDTGSIRAGGREEPIAELELELLSGSPAYLFALARELQGKARLTLLFESKAERGYRLAGHDEVVAIKAQQTAIGPGTTGGDAFRAVAREALVQVAGNARLMFRAPHADTLHQIRVGLRRLRAAFSVFKPILDEEGLTAARSEARWLAGELGPARDIDVFLQRTEPPEDVDEDAGRTAFFRAVRRAQADAYERALAALSSERFNRLLITLGEWIEVGAWSRLTDPPAEALRDGPVSSIAVPVLRKLRKRVRNAGRLRDLDVAERHEFRKEAKKLRYAASFFSGVFSEHPKRRRRFIDGLRTVQDHLGALNDIAVARTVALEVAGPRSSGLAFAAGLEVGRLACDEDEELARADKSLRAFRETRPFWEGRPVPA